TDQNETPSHIDTEITDLPAYGTSTPTQCSAPQPAYGIAHNQIYVEQPGFPKRVSSQRGGGNRYLPRAFRITGFFSDVQVFRRFGVLSVVVAPVYRSVPVQQPFPSWSAGLGPAPRNFNLI